MNVKIKSILLWPHNPENKIRRIDFKCSGVEVISGWSEKGKSSIIHIIDYCLGSEKCSIPIGKVRDMVDWFGVLLALPQGKQVLCARRNPGQNQESSEMMFLQGKQLKIPRQPAKTHSRDTVITELDDLANLPARGPAEDEESDSDGPPSFRDMAAFNFQPQHIVANPNILFFKADLWEHRRKLIRSVLPYVLGAVDAKTLDYQARLRGKEAKLKIKREELDLKNRAMAGLNAGFRAHFRTAQNYELIGPEISPSPEWTALEFSKVLQNVPSQWRKHPPIPSVTSIAKKARAEVTSLQKSQTRLVHEIDDAQRQLNKILRVSESFEGYSSSLKNQIDRISPVGWLQKRFSNRNHCPFCHDKTVSSLQLESLVQATKQLSETVMVVSDGTPILTAEVRKLEKQIEELEEKLRLTEVQICDWEARSQELNDIGNRRDFINSFVGRLESELEALDAGGASKLEGEVKKLESEVRELQHMVNPELIRKKTDAAIAQISKGISFYAKSMGVGHANQNWLLDDKNLTLVSHHSGRDDYLWEIGSAANWMGFHVATLLALHEFFRSVPHNPVPKFIVFDQPSQAYFPEGLGKQRGKATKDIVASRSDDVTRLRRLFTALANAIDRTKGGLQIILLEHAEPEMWQGTPHFTLPDKTEWREHGALIPADWI